MSLDAFFLLVPRLWKCMGNRLGSCSCGERWTKKKSGLPQTFKSGWGDPKKDRGFLILVVKDKSRDYSTS